MHDIFLFINKKYELLYTLIYSKNFFV